MRGYIGNLRQLRSRRLFFAAILAISLVLPLAGTGLQKAGATPPPYPYLVSQNSSGEPADGDLPLHSCPDNDVVQLSDNGRYAMFCSGAQNMGTQRSGMFITSVFVRDLQTNTTTLASVNTAGDQENGRIVGAKLSGDGRHVLFITTATNIDARISGQPGTQGWSAYVRNLDTLVTELVSINNDGVPIRYGQRASISYDGGVVTFVGSTTVPQPQNSSFNLYVRNLTQGVTTQITSSYDNLSLVSGNGRYVFYGDDPYMSQTRRYDLETNVSAIVSVNSNGFLGNGPSAPVGTSHDGRYVLISSRASNLDAPGTTPNACFRYFRHDNVTNANDPVEVRSDGSVVAACSSTDTVAALSADGTVVALNMPGSLGMTSESYDWRQVYVRDLTNAETRLVSKNRWGKASQSHTFWGVDLDASGSNVAFGALIASSFEAPPYSEFFVGPANGVYPDTDNTAPMVSGLSWSNNPVDQWGTSVLTVNGIDSQSGVWGAEFYPEEWGSVEPGRGCSLTFKANGQFELNYGWDSCTDTNTLGVHKLVVRVMDGAGNWSQDYHTSITVGEMPPTLGALTWTVNPKSISEATTLTVGASDDRSGVARGEYFVGDADPGQGNGAVMNWDGTSLTTTFGTDFAPGVYKVSVRAQDNAGNWSDPVSDYLVVYDPNGPRMTGKRTITPSLSNGDVLPGLISASQTDTAIFAFSVKYDASGQINTNSDLQFKYQTGTKCKNAAQAQNCHNFNLDATSIAWLTTQGTNNSTGIFQGTATLVVDGVTSQVIFRVTGVDGSRLGGTSPDSFEVRIFAQGDDPNTATPIYVINPTSITQGDIKII